MFTSAKVSLTEFLTETGSCNSLPYGKADVSTVSQRAVHETPSFPAVKSCVRLPLTLGSHSLRMIVPTNSRWVASFFPTGIFTLLVMHQVPFSDILDGLVTVKISL